MEYNIEIEKIVKAIKKEKAKIVLLQFPDGLKPKAMEVAEIIESKTGTKCAIWMGSCFGACDIPPVSEISKLGVNMIIQFGHIPWPYKNKDIKVINLK